MRINHGDEYRTLQIGKLLDDHWRTSLTGGAHHENSPFFVLQQGKLFLEDGYK